LFPLFKLTTGGHNVSITFVLKINEQFFDSMVKTLVGIVRNIKLSKFWVILDGKKQSEGKHIFEAF
jgi:hypothetical protein